MVMAGKGSCAISIKGIKVFAHHGVLAEEKERGQEFLIDISLELYSPPAADELGGTVDYAGVATRAAALATEETFDLLESVAMRIAGEILLEDLVRTVTVTVSKTQAPMPVEVESVSATVKLERSGSRGYFTGEEK